VRCDVRYTMSRKYPMRVLNRIAYSLVVTATVVGSTTARPLPVISACELIQHPQMWEGKVVSIKGAVVILPYETPVIAGMRVFLLPAAPDKCSYSDSKYINSDEQPQIMLDYPDYHFRKTPAGASVDDSTFGWAVERLRSIRKEHPGARQAIVTVEGFVSLRKYNLRDLEQKIRAGQLRHPRDPLPPPVILTLQAYRSVDADSRP
jgi:hypothetical protein